MHIGHAANPLPAAAQTNSTATGPNPKLVNAAHEFEGQMMKELLQPMMQGIGGDDEDDDSGVGLDSGSGSGGALAGFASETLGQALSERGGFGIANSIISELSRNGNRQGTRQVTQNTRVNTVMRVAE